MTDQYFIKTIFANSGDVAVVPVATQPDGSVSYEKGFPVGYQEEPGVDPGAYDVPRDQFNQLMNNITNALQFLQVHGFPDFITSAANGGAAYSYDINATVRFTGGWAGVGAMNYYSLVDTNTTTPADATKWGLVKYQNFELPGVCKEYMGATLPTGYVWANGTTIGNASSNATGLADASTASLFTVLWTSYPNTTLGLLNSAGTPVARGVSAAADFAANRQLPVPDKRENVSVGKGDMGGTSDPGRLTLAAAGFDPAVLGASGGAQTVALSSAQNGTHTHTATANTAGTHTHTGTTTANAGHRHLLFETNAGNNQVLTSSNFANNRVHLLNSDDYNILSNLPQDQVEPSTGLSGLAGGDAVTLSIDSAGAHTHTVTVDNAGSSTPHLNVQPTIVSNFIIALGTA